ncbi:MAG: mannose-6-phosphate isomerase, class I, partial [Bacteroidetes bacterium]|nr:mannose-6-phosphate isomerase, class I [Bacteroidota bacterium]
MAGYSTVGLVKLKGRVQHYNWGGYDYIPALLGILNEERKPYAEYWLGAHPSASSMIIDETGTGEEMSLNRAMQLDAAFYLGRDVFNQFKSLPYLLKVLDVRDMLSIQVHPSKKAAEIEFARENNERIPVDAAFRNYKDDNHKPELAAALSDFWLLHGFKKEAELVQTLSSVPELLDLVPVFNESGYEGLYKMVMGMPQKEVNAMLQPLLGRIIPLYQQNLLRKAQEDFWAARAALTFNEEDKIDRGIFSIYLFNLVHLRKGEAIFQDAGIPHAYLEGQNVEIMANSDNVLRGGLTNKHIDVKELMKHVRCEGIEPNVLTGDNTGVETIYKTLAPDFELSSFLLPAKGRTFFRTNTAEIWIVIQGSIECRSASNTLMVEKGQAALAVAEIDITITA